MDDIEYEKYFLNLLIAILSDAKDLQGLIVLVKIDSRPGNSNLYHLERIRIYGYYLYPVVYNTTSVSQETNQNFGFSNQ